MATRNTTHSTLIEAHVPGVPEGHGLGAAAREAWALIGAVLVLALIFLGTWWTATH